MTDKETNLTRRQVVISSAENIFGMDVTDYPQLEQRQKELNFLNKLYGLYKQVNDTIDDYSETPWESVDMEKINTEIQDFVNRCKLLPKGLKDWPAFIDLKKKIDDFYEICPLIEMMVDESMQERHWQSLEKLLDAKFNIHSPDFTLGQLLSAPLLKNKELIEDICVGATKEGDIESKLKQVIAEWSGVVLSVVPFKDRGDLLIKAGDVTEIINQLDDSLMIMSSLASNRFNGPFKKDIMLWLNRLTTTYTILEKFLQVQNLWAYLEAVFSGGDISKQLPGETKRFSNIDKLWTRLMAKVKDTQKAVEICAVDENTAHTLNFLSEQLELCQKSLTGYLEAKRLIFPRFFFISDPVLLEILGQASDPTSIQPHLENLFDGVAKVSEKY